MIDKQESDNYTIEHRNAKYRVGQKVIVVDEDVSYPTYFDWITDNKLCLTDEKVRELWSKYLGANRNNCEAGIELIVVATGYHILSRAVMYLCEDTNGNPVLISEDGLTTDEEKHLEWTNLKDNNAYWQKIADFETKIEELKDKLYLREHLLRMLVFWRRKNKKEFNAYFREAEKLFKE